MIEKILKERWSPVIFSRKPVEEDKLNSLFVAASLAPSSYNQQPWRFVLCRQGDENYQQILGLLNPGNQVWAANAPVLVLSVAEVISSYNGKKNMYAFHDTGMAVGNLLAQATAVGLHVHQMGGYEHEKAKTILSIPDGFEPVAMMAIGYLGDAEGASEELIKRDKKRSTRRDLSETVFVNRFGGDQKT